MSVQTEITRIQSAKRAISEAIGAKGVEVPPTAKLDDLAALAEKIPGPKPEQEKEITISENGDVTITPDVGKALSKVLAKVNVSGGGGGFDPAPFKSLHTGTLTPATDMTQWKPDGYNSRAKIFLLIGERSPNYNDSKYAAVAMTFQYLGAIGTGNRTTDNYPPPQNFSGFAFNSNPLKAGATYYYVWGEV